MPNRTSFNHNEWAIDHCRAREAWQSHNTKGAGVVVAHPDGGFTSHSELTPNYLRNEAKNFIDYNWFSGNYDKSAEDPLDGGVPGHGTATAAVLLSSPGPYHGNTPPEDHAFPPGAPQAFVTGIAPEASGIPLKVTTGGIFGANVILNLSEIAALQEAIYYCLSLRNRAVNPVDVAVMSISLGHPSPVPPFALRAALKVARLSGLIVVAAAGQIPDEGFTRGARRFFTSFKGPIYPGYDDNVICVAACAIDDGKLMTGFYGSAVDITAAGVDIWMADAKPKQPGLHVNRSAGTSYATAVVAGACALWQARHVRAALIGTYGRDKIFSLFKHCLQSSAFVPDVGWDSSKRGAGILDVKKLLDFPLPPKALVDGLP